MHITITYLGFTRFSDIKDVRSLPTILISLGLLITLSTTACENKMADFIAPLMKNRLQTYN